VILLLALSACWKTDEPVSFETVPFANDLAATPDGQVQAIETDLRCPDGEPARIYIVWPASQTERMPVAVVLHSSAFDYVTEPIAEDPLFGEHYAAADEDGTTRMEAAWGVRKVWETLGMHPQVEPAESNLGALPSALLDAGIVGVYPTNCWGDLWHNASPDATNDQGAEFLEREGGTFAWWQIRWMIDASFATTQGITPKALLDPSELYLIGLGDGARAAIELGQRPELPQVTGILLDSPVIDMELWAESSPGVAEGLSRIYHHAAEAGDTGGEESIDWNDWTLRRQVNKGTMEGVRLAVVHSSADPRVPAGNMDDLTAYLADPVKNKFPDHLADFCLLDRETSTHVQTNGDIVIAREVVSWLKGEAGIPECEYGFEGGGEPADTGE
jgi:hypothetical protein